MAFFDADGDIAFNPVDPGAPAGLLPIDPVTGKYRPAEPPPAPPPSGGGIGSDAVGAPNQPPIPPPQVPLMTPREAAGGAPGGPMTGPPASITPPGATPASGPIPPGVPQPGQQPQQPPPPPYPFNVQPAQRAPVLPAPYASAGPVGDAISRMTGVDPARVNAAMTGFGSGIQNIKGNGAAASFARGMGGGIVGTNNAQDKQFVQSEAARAAAVNQSSTAFQDLLKAKQEGDNQKVQDARVKLWNAQANAIQSGGNKSGGRAWQGTDYGKLHLAESEAQKWYDSRLNALKLRAPLMNDQDKSSALEKLDKDYQTMLQQKYKQYGIDPNKVDTIKKTGTEEATPFEPRSHTDFSTMPNGSYFKNPSDGKVYQFDRDKWEQQYGQGAQQPPALSYDPATNPNYDAAAP